MVFTIKRTMHWILPVYGSFLSLLEQEEYAIFI